MASQIILHAFDHNKEEPSSSGYCQKLEAYLRFSSADYRQENALPQNSPTRQLPFVEYGGAKVTDSEMIIRWLAEQKEFGGGTLDERCGLTALEASESTAYRLLVEQGLYPAMARERWLNAENRSSFLQQYLSYIPWIVRLFIVPMIVRKTRNALYHKSVGRFTDEQVGSIMVSLLDDIEVRLKSVAGRGLWFHGEKGPSNVDSVIYGILVTSLTTKSFPTVTKGILERSALSKYMRGITEKYFPEYKSVLATLDKGEVVMRTDLQGSLNQ